MVKIPGKILYIHHFLSKFKGCNHVKYSVRYNCVIKKKESNNFVSLFFCFGYFVAFFVCLFVCFVLAHKIIFFLYMTDLFALASSHRIFARSCLKSL